MTWESPLRSGTDNTGALSWEPAVSSVMAKGEGWGGDPQGGFAYIIGLGLLGWSLETRSQCHSKQLSYIQENLPLASWSSPHFFPTLIRMFS